MNEAIMYLLQASATIALSFIVTAALVHGCGTVLQNNENDFWMTGLVLGCLSLGGFAASCWLIFDSTIQFRIQSLYWSTPLLIPYGVLPGLHFGAVLVAIFGTIFVWGVPRTLSRT